MAGRGTTSAKRPRAAGSGRKYLRNNWPLYVMMLPGLVILIIFRYVPMGGLVMAFQDFNIYQGIMDSPFVGLEQFRELFRSVQFWPAFRNTLILGVMRLVFATPAPLILALLLNEVRNRRFKKTVQTLTYIPYFVSWVVIFGLISVFINPTDGILPALMQRFGYTDPINILSSNTWFRWVLLLTNIYKFIGFNAIIYLSSISSIDPNLYEAALMDGAGRWKQCLHITLPCIVSTIAIMLILDVGYILEAGFDQVYMFYNPLVYETGDIIDTFVYRKAISDSSYSMSAAAQLFKSAIGMVLIFGSNLLVKRIDKDSALW